MWLAVIVLSLPSTYRSPYRSSNSVCILWICFLRSILCKMQAIYAKTGKLYRADSGIPAAVHIKYCPFPFLTLRRREKVYKDTAPSRPQFMAVRPFVFRKVKTDAGRCKAMPRTHNFQIAGINYRLCRKMVITWRDVDDSARFPCLLSSFWIKSISSSPNAITSVPFISVPPSVSLLP